MGKPKIQPKGTPTPAHLAMHFKATEAFMDLEEETHFLVVGTLALKACQRSGVVLRSLLGGGGAEGWMIGLQTQGPERGGSQLSLTHEIC